MSRLLSNKPEDQDVGRGWESIGLLVNGRLWSNSAAKFWCGLIDEVFEDFPDCDRMEMIFPMGAPFTRDMLRPESCLERDIERLSGKTLEEVLRESLAELDLLGPPSAVSIRVFRDEEQLLAADFPQDCVDAEIFPFLVVWLLEWAQIPESSWNDGALAGGIVADNFGKTFRYDIAFELSSEHLSEGLYRRVVTLRVKRERQEL